MNANILKNKPYFTAISLILYSGLGISQTANEITKPQDHMEQSALFNSGSGIIKKKYVIKAGRTASSTFTEWAALDGKKIIWEAQDLIFEDDMDFDGELAQILTRILVSINSQGYPLRARMYTENDSIRFFSNPPK